MSILKTFPYIYPIFYRTKEKEYRKIIRKVDKDAFMSFTSIKGIDGKFNKKVIEGTFKENFINPGSSLYYCILLFYICNNATNLCAHCFSFKCSYASKIISLSLLLKLSLSLEN